MSMCSFYQEKNDAAKNNLLTNTNVQHNNDHKEIYHQQSRRRRNQGLGTKQQTPPPPLWTYIPRMPVDDFAVIDWDQQEMEAHLKHNNKATYHFFLNAQAIYTLGAHSKSYASITLDIPLPQMMSQGTKVQGYNRENLPIQGTLATDVPAGSDHVKVLYHTNSEDRNHSNNCFVGISKDPIFNGCFTAWGNLTFLADNDNDDDDVTTIDYGYNPISDNANAISLQKLSSRAQHDMLGCPNCPYEDFNKYYQYYGKATYANDYIEAAFDNRNTTFDFTNTNPNDGNIAFNKYKENGRAEVISKSTVIMNIWMYITFLMELSIDTCINHCQCSTGTSVVMGSNATTCACNYDIVAQIWDGAVALYTGSLAAANNGKQNGYLLFGNANKEGQHFKTCGTDGQQSDGIAQVNYEIFKLFRLGQANILSGFCTDTRSVKEQIVQQMTIPLIQGTLRYAYYGSAMMGNEGQSSETTAAIGAAYAAAVVPLVNACAPHGPNFAQTIQDFMKVGNDGNSKPNFLAIKSVLEHVYECLGIECKQVGGIVDPVTNEYYDKARPCDPSKPMMPYYVPLENTDTTNNNDQQKISPPPPSSSDPSDMDRDPEYNGRPLNSDYKYGNEEETHMNKERPEGFSRLSSQKLDPGVLFAITFGVFFVVAVLVLMCSICWETTDHSEWHHDSPPVSDDEEEGNGGVGPV